MKKLIVLLIILVGGALAAWGLLTFYLVDNFDDGTYSKWFSFDNVKLGIFKNPKLKTRDLVLESCGEYALKINGTARDWYVGGVGTNLAVDTSNYSRFQMDLFGSRPGGKIKIELYEDDDLSGEIEQDAAMGWKPTRDDIWEVEIPILGGGYTRYSIPFTAFTDSNPGVGNDAWGGTGSILRVQLIFIAASQEGSVDCAVDNIIFTY
jgi:hypothetical protein